MALRRTTLGRKTEASEGDLCRRVLSENAETGAVEVCKKPLPPGALTYLGYNTGQGGYLMLCADCRKELDEALGFFLAAEVHVERMLSKLTSLPSGVLMSEEEMRQILREAGEVEGARGPLGKAKRLRAIQLRHGLDERRRFVKANPDYQGLDPVDSQ